MLTTFFSFITYREEQPEPVVQIRRIVMPFPFPQNMHRFGPQMGPQMGPSGPQFPPHMGPQYPPQMGPQFPPQMGPQFPPQFQPQNQMNMPPPPPQMQFQQPQMQFQQPQMNFPQPQMRIPFPQQNLPFQPQQQQFPQAPAQQMTPPRPEVPQFRLINPAPQQMPNFERPQSQEIDQSENQPEFRIHLRRIQIPGPIGDIFPFLNKIRNDIQDKETEMEAPRQNIQVHQMPLAVALSKVGITPDDLRNIQRMAEEKFQEHIRELVADEVDDSSSDSESVQSGEETGKIQTVEPELYSSEEKQKEDLNQELHEASSQQQEQSDEQPQILALGRSNFGRSLNPVQLPDHMTEDTEIHEAERTARAACEYLD